MINSLTRFSFAALALTILAGCGRARTEGPHADAEEWTRISDPGRGFYRHTERRSAGSPSPEVQALRAWRDEGSTLVMRVCYLGEFIDSDLSTTYLEALRRDFSAIRDAGMKAIVRFAYSDSMEAAESRQAGEKVVLRHVTQLAPVLAENADVLHCVQAGFIGAWGEWHAVHPDYRADDGSLSPAATRRLMGALLAAVPEPVFLQMRTPWQKMMIFDESMAGADRVGHHNDCFLASEDDLGTYQDREGEILWLEQETLSLPMGGETCGVNPPRSSGGMALEEMTRLHFNYLNLDYHPGVIQSWQQSGAFYEIAARLGHRIRLLAVEPGPAGTTLTFLNDGFAAPLYERPLEWRDGNRQVGIVDGFSMRSLAPGQEQSVVIAGASPPFEVRLPDRAENLRDRGEYAARLVNLTADASGWHSIDSFSQPNR